MHIVISWLCPLISLSSDPFINVKFWHCNITTPYVRQKCVQWRNFSLKAVHTLLIEIFCTVIETIQYSSCLRKGCTDFFHLKHKIFDWNKWSVNTTIFHQNKTTCFGSPNPLSGVYRLEIYRNMWLHKFAILITSSQRMPFHWSRIKSHLSTSLTKNYFTITIYIIFVTIPIFLTWQSDSILLQNVLLIYPYK
jgi:hypothetical protein